MPTRVVVLTAVALHLAATPAAAQFRGGAGGPFGIAPPPALDGRAGQRRLVLGQLPFELQIQLQAGNLQDMGEQPFRLQSR